MARIGSILLLVVVCLSAPARAQEHNETQLDLYRRAYEAFQAEDYAGAEALLRAALRIGDQNILHLSLARALMLQGNCQQAIDELTQAEAAPAVASLGPGEFRARLAEYRGDLQRVCPGSVRVLCEPPDMRIRIGDRREESCRTGRVSLMPGDYLVQGRVGNRTVRSSVSVSAMHESTVELLLTATPDRPSDGGAGGGRSRPWRTFGWGAGIAGSLALGVAFVVDLVFTGNAIEEFQAAARAGDQDAAGLKRDAEGWQLGGIVAYGSAATLLVTGTVALLLTSSSD